MPHKPAPNIPTPNKKRGRKPAVLDLTVIERAAGIGCTIDEIAAVMNVHRDTLYGRIAKEPEIGLAIARGRDNGKATLRRLQWQAANDGNPTMLIWLGKQLLEQRDKHEVGGVNGGPITYQIITGVHRPGDPEGPK
jgi:hypothetical protein